MSVKYTNFYLHRFGSNSDKSYLLGEILEDFGFTSKVKWNNGQVTIENNFDLDRPFIPPTICRVFDFSGQILENWKKIDDDWVLVEIPKKMEYRRAVSEKDRWLISKAPEIFRKKHDERGLTEYEWSMIK